MISLYPSDERVALAAAAARWASDRFKDNAECEFDAARWREMAELGWLAAVVSETHGGLGLAPSHASVVAEAIAPAAMVEPYAAQAALAGHLLDRADAADARDAALAAWLAGESLIALAHGEDATPAWSASIATRCVADGGDWVLDGRKPLVRDGMLASHYVVSARDDEGTLALFLLPAAGVRRELRLAIDGRPHCDLLLERLRVPRTARLRFAEGAGAALASAAWLHALLVAAEMVGLARAMTRASHEYLCQREQFGRKLIEFQVLQHRLVDMTLTVTRLESLLEVARLKCDAAGPAGAAPWIAAAKAAAGEEGRVLGRQAVQLHGAIGLTAELPLGRQLRRLAALEFAAGGTAHHLDYWSAHRAAP